MTNKEISVFCYLQQHPSATSGSEPSAGGASGACGTSGAPQGGDAACSSRGGSGGAAGGGQGCEQGGGHHSSTSHGTRESQAKFRHGLLQLMIHTIDPLHDGQSRAGIILFTLYHSRLLFAEARSTQNLFCCWL